ncbi:MAG: 1-acyl-sn-glycerol-3-phosphate acyltransferase [Deltaproteobacteria bacterium]|nr:1-acyl-sn-glycerol-3-phosphate acyltransferase [Deltaproteobacteria bacterium]
MTLYSALRGVLATALRVFFREIAVVGDEQVPADGPLILAGNHPNSLIDPALLVAVTPRQVRFAAKDVLFRSALLRPVLAGLGAVPIARKADHAGANDNSDAFATLTNVLAGGGAMGIFPEGLSHDDAHLHELKTGAARIALQTALASGVRPMLVPVGLNYMRAKRFRSRVLVQFGAPVAIDDALLEQARTDLFGAGRALTANLDAGLRSLTINAADWPTLRVLDAVRRLYQPRGISFEARVELARRFTTVYATIADKPEVAALFARVQAWLERLEAAGLRDRDLGRDWRPLELVGRSVGHLALLGLWLPLALAGGVLHAPIGLAISFAGPLVSPRKDVVATTKLLMGLLAMPAVAAAFVGAAWHWYGTGAAIAAAILMPISGLATLRVLERWLALQRLLTTSLRIFSLRRELRELRTERDELERQVVELVGRYKPADMVALFPRDAVPQ